MVAYLFWQYCAERLISRGASNLAHTPTFGAEGRELSRFLTLLGERNFPQAFTHLALISAALSLDRMLGVRFEQRRSFQKALGGIHAGSDKDA
jgi:hypothetical protein